MPLRLTRARTVALGAAVLVCALVAWAWRDPMAPLRAVMALQGAWVGLSEKRVVIDDHRWAYDEREGKEKAETFHAKGGLREFVGHLNAKMKPLHPEVVYFEGEKDDISGVGQTQAAHTLCTSVPDDRRVLYVQPEVGHYGVFNGRRFREEIYPRVRDFIARNEARLGVSQRSAAAA